MSMPYVTEGERETADDLICILFKPFTLFLFLWILLTSISLCQLGISLHHPFLFSRPRLPGARAILRSWQCLEPVSLHTLSYLVPTKTLQWR